MADPNPNPKPPPHKGGRSRTGTFIKSPSTKKISFKYWKMVDGVEIRTTVPLHTDNDRVAKAKATIILRSGGAEYDPSAPETFAQAADRIVGDQRDEGLKTWSERLSRITNYCAELTARPVNKITEGEIENVLHAAAKGDGEAKPPLSQSALDHLHTDLAGIFKELWRTRAIPENPMDRVRQPRATKPKDQRDPVLLTDAEFFLLVESDAVPEWLKTMAVAMRYVGGQRTSDAHAWDWSHFDLASWKTAHVYRPKTEKRGQGDAPVVLATLTQLELDKFARKRLKAWWVSQGSPAKGPVFPVRKGDRVGERQVKRSHARELRHYLWEAGVHRPLDGFSEARATLRKAERTLAVAGKSERRLAQRARLAAELAAKALDALQTDTTQTLRAHVHSFRRAFATGLAMAGINEQQAMRLAGHSSSATHKRYVKFGQRAALVTPAAALPRKPGQKRQKSGS